MGISKKRNGEQKNFKIKRMQPRLCRFLLSYNILPRNTWIAVSLLSRVLLIVALRRGHVCHVLICRRLLILHSVRRVETIHVGHCVRAHALRLLCKVRRTHRVCREGGRVHRGATEYGRLLPNRRHRCHGKPIDSILQVPIHVRLVGYLDVVDVRTTAFCGLLQPRVRPAREILTVVHDIICIVAIRGLLLRVLEGHHLWGRICVHHVRCCAGRIGRILPVRWVYSGRQS